MRKINKIISFPILLISIVLPVVTGCSGNNPTSPDPAVQQPALVQNQDVKGRNLLGLWQVAIDLNNSTVDMIPLRESEAHLNILAFLEMEILTGFNVDISTLAIDIVNGTIDADVIISHPLPGYTEYTLFDVRGIIITDGSATGLSIDDSIVYPGPEESRLVNADGYTRWWNPREFQGWGLLCYIDGLLGAKDSFAHFGSKINGFKYFGDGLGLNDEVMKPVFLHQVRTGCFGLFHFQLCSRCRMGRTCADSSPDA
jgi:hypothetical protein